MKKINGADIHIENDRLMLCKPESTDLQALTAMVNDRKVYRYEPSFLAELQGTPAEALEVIRKMDLDKDRQCILGIYEKNNPDTLVGLAELYDYKASGKVISIGCRLRSKYWGKGIGTNCVSALLDFFKNNTGIELVTAHVMPGNKTSSRLLTESGFEYTHTVTEDWGRDKLTVADVYIMDMRK